LTHKVNFLSFREALLMPYRSRSSRSLHQDLLFYPGPKSQSSSNSLGSSLPTEYLAAISSSCIGRSGLAISRGLQHCPCEIKHRNPDPRWSTVNTQPSRRFPYWESAYERSRLLTFQNPECRCAMPRVVLHATPVGPFATRNLAIPQRSLRL
jgi:hypothetical protein